VLCNESDYDEVTSTANSCRARAALVAANAMACSLAMVQKAWMRMMAAFSCLFDERARQVVEYRRKRAAWRAGRVLEPRIVAPADGECAERWAGKSDRAETKVAVATANVPALCTILLLNTGLPGLFASRRKKAPFRG
jgi:hypothetical protein